MRFTLLICLLFAGAAVAQTVKVPIVGLPCEGCEAVFDGLPAQLNSRARIAPKSEPGAPMVVVGRVLDAKGRPRAGVVVYAYQTNSQGVYPQSASVRDPETRRQGTLRAWVRSDAAGRYAFDTIRPGSYPGENVPEHIHMHVIEPGCSTYYIDDVMFADDPKLTRKQRASLVRERGGDGVSAPARKDGVWYVTRDIHLGRNIPGYRVCGR